MPARGVRGIASDRGGAPKLVAIIAKPGGNIAAVAHRSAVTDTSGNAGTDGNAGSHANAVRYSHADDAADRDGIVRPE